MPNYLTASNDIADWCAAHKLNDAVVKHWIKAERAVDALTVAGIPRADIAALGPAAKTFLEHHMPPRECRETWPTLPTAPPKAETTQDAPSAAPTTGPVKAGPTAEAPLSPVMAAPERNSKRHGKRDRFDGMTAAPAPIAKSVTPAAPVTGLPAPATRPTEARVPAVQRGDTSADWARRQLDKQADADALWSKAIERAAPKPGRLA